MATLDDFKLDLSEEARATVLTVRLLMQGKDVGSIIGKKGEIVKRFREESGAKINISDSSSPERIVTISGNVEAIYRVFALVCRKAEEATVQHSPGTAGRPPITMRLVMPASQCGSLIGRGGARIKEIRELTNSSIQVASEMLPSSTERVVTVTGSCQSVTQCLHLICGVMLESPPKGAAIMYRPKPQSLAPACSSAPVLFGAPTAQPYNLAPNGFTLNSNGQPCSDLAPLLASQGAHAPGTAVNGSGLPGTVVAPHTPLQLSPHVLDAKSGQLMLPGLPTPMSDIGKGHHMPSLVTGIAGMTSAHHSLQATTNSAITALAALNNPAHHQAAASHQLRAAAPQLVFGGTQLQELTVPNELIGCVIGKGGTKIAEIRQLTGALITISKFDDTTEDGTHQDRVITIKGSIEQIALAQYLINTRISLETASMGVAGLGFQYISPNHIIKLPIH